MPVPAADMTLGTTIAIVDGSLQVHGKTLLSDVHDNITLSPAGLPHGAFLGAKASHSSHYHVFPLGVLEGHRFLCCFRFKLWWMTQRMGSSARDIPAETQFLLVESKGVSPAGEETDVGSETSYTVFLPLLEGPFRAILQGNEKNELEFCFESGDPAVQTNEGVSSIFIHAGVDPYQVISDAVRSVQSHLQTFRHRENKQIPSFLDWFGWCTWDAFYTDVDSEGIENGLESLTAGGTSPRFLIIDDGWQSVDTDHQLLTAAVTDGTGFASRLTNIKENYKFQKDGKDGERQEDSALGLRHIIHETKKQHNVKYVYVWHALTGYWGGVKPGIPEMEHYESAVKYPVPSPGISVNEPDFALDIMVSHGLGLVHPNRVFQFYDELHSYLAAAGIDGVKVDVQNILETLGAGFGGRVSLTRKYHQALEASIARNFPDNGCISCMCHNTDGIYSSNQTAVIRASDDFYPRDPISHTIHIASVAYNSLFLGEFMQPDWDMFHSLHPAAEYHAAARAVGGCAIYVSDKPGNHDFDLLKRLVLPDGSILRAQLPGRPTRDCLFCDPTQDGKSLLKIWNMNKYTGVVGAFNCQGAGWCKIEKKNLLHDAEPKTVSGSIHAEDANFLPQVAGDGWNGDAVMYSHKQGELVLIPKGSSLPLTLKSRDYEVFTVVPVKVFAPGVSFAPIGLIKMFNAGGAIKSYEVTEAHIKARTDLDRAKLDPASLTLSSNGQPVALVKLKVHGCGLFGIYSSVRPKRFLVDLQSVEFTHNIKNGLGTISLPFSNQEGQLWDILVEI